VLVVTPTSLVVGPGETARLTAWTIGAGGNRQLVSGRAVWTSSDDAIASVAAKGDDGVTIAARAPGLASVMVTLGDVHTYVPVGVPRGSGAANGLLRRDARLPRHFVDQSGRPVYLTGSHTWATLQDADTVRSVSAFDYDAYLDTLQSHNHNFIRLWQWEQANWSTDIRGPYWITPTVYERTGPDTANDGEPRFDLARFNDAYFARLRLRVAAAQRRGIYVSVMLFNGWSVESKGRAVDNPWRGHPFHRNNNVNGIDGDPDRDNAGLDVHRLTIPAVVRLEERYVRRVVDAVNEFDNVLYEVSNESRGGSAAWQHHIIELIHEYEARLGKRHPVGMTVERPGESGDALFGGPADWVSPWRQAPDAYRSVSNYGPKVVIDDTDHLCGVCGTVDWIWQSFTSGTQPILMDPYDGKAVGFGALDDQLEPRQWEGMRRNMGYARALAAVVDLAHVEPLGALSSAGYCLASPLAKEAEYVAVAPTDDAIWLNLEGAGGRTLSVQWLEWDTGRVVRGPDVHGGGSVRFQPPSRGGAALYLRALPSSPPAP
jgi:hypothetical protein